MIARYLKGTVDKGTIIQPAKSLQLDLYVDAEYGGLFKREDDRDLASAQSRGGYIILLSGCPVIWKSSLIKEITLSTLESENVSLSKALRILLPLKCLLQEMCSHLDLPENFNTTINAAAFEDNQSAFQLATTQRLTNRTRYLHTKWHWFWQHYKNGDFTVHKCATKDQKGDYMTKGLVRDLFENNRRSTQGW